MEVEQDPSVKIAFNTTDLPHVRDELKRTIEGLFADDKIRIAVISNRGWKENAQYNLEVVDFSDDSKQICEVVQNAHGEGSDWLTYYRQVLQCAPNLTWGSSKSKYLILIGDQGVDAVRDASMQQEVQKLQVIGVKVFAFHHSQLFLLQSIMEELD